MTSPRQKLLLDEGWLFHRGDIDPPLANTHIAAYMNMKAGYARGAAKPGYDDSDWQTVDLPHDWSTDGPFDAANHISNGYLPRGVSWYRRRFTLDESFREKVLTLQFDGVATHCTVYVNGHLVHRHFSGYTPFTIDITDIAHIGPDTLNTIAVRVDATPVEGWWYEGAGIYRHVWLVASGAVRVIPNGLSVRTGKDANGEWWVQIETIIENRTDLKVSGMVWHELESGEVFASKFVIPARETWPTQSFKRLPNPKVWTRKDPSKSLVTTTVVPFQKRSFAKAELDNDVPRPAPDELKLIPLSHDDITNSGMSTDKVMMCFGFRTIQLQAENGFFLNDQPTKLLGTCKHQDHAGVGVALPDSLQRFRIRRLKEIGCNAIRCAHNPPTPELLDACDELGMLVMNENRLFGSTPEVLDQLGSMVKRDRNHPSVVLWSICNEEAIQGTPISGNIARTMIAHVQSLDPTRPVTAAVSGGILNDGAIGSVLPVMSINYQLARHDDYHAKYPNIPLIAGETHCVFATRGETATNVEKHRYADDDSQTAPWGTKARETFDFVMARPFIAGYFVWTGFDYRGEPTPHSWPSVQTHWGLLDLCGFPKETAYRHSEWWGGTLHQMRNASPVPLPLREGLGEGCDAVQVNASEHGGPMNESLTASASSPSPQPSPSRVEGAIAWGAEVDPTSALDPIVANGEHAFCVTVFALDGEGQRVARANQKFDCTLEGPGRVLGTGNGDPTCHEPNHGSSRSLFNGLAQVIVQTRFDPGTIRLKFTGAGLNEFTLDVPVLPGDRRPHLPPAAARWVIGNWRQSPPFSLEPDVNRTFSNQDMNTWLPVDFTSPRPMPSDQLFVLIRATATPPTSIQQKGGLIRVNAVTGPAEIFVDGALVAKKDSADEERIDIPIEPSTQPRVVVVRMRCTGEQQGPTRLVEFVET